MNVPTGRQPCCNSRQHSKPVTKNPIFNIIREAHGAPGLQLARQYEQLALKTTTTLGKLTFLLKCRDAGLLPKSFHLTWTHVLNTKTTRIVQEAGFKLLRATIKEHRTTIARLKNQRNDTENELRAVISEEHVQQVLRHVEFLCAMTSMEQKRNLRRKLENLYCSRSWEFCRSRKTAPRQTTRDLDRAVVNLSSQPLSEIQTSVLAKGLTFVPAPRTPSVLDIIASAEQSLTKTDPQKSADIKFSIASVLLKQQGKNITSNLDCSERQALKELKANPNLHITKADKGNVVVLLDRETYMTKVSDLLSKPIYVPLKEDPTVDVRKELIQILDIFISDSHDATASRIRQHLHYTSNVRCPELYGLPKIHKPGAPLRPVVSSINSVTSRVCSYLKDILRPLTGLRESYVKNSKQFCEEIRSLTISDHHVLVSYDIRDLFTNIPIPLTLNILQDLLDRDIELGNRTTLNPFHVVKLVSFCMNEGNYFRFQDRFFSQNSGAPMGSPLSPILAEIFMEHFERTAFSTADVSIKPVFFKRYVDDIFAIVETGREERFLEHLNSLFPNNIQLTIEKETNRRLPFLDALVIREGPRLATTVYRKPTHSDRYLHFSSHHPLTVKMGIVRGMVDRAIAICDQQYLQPELKHIERALIDNGYPKKLLRSITNRRMTIPGTRNPDANIPLVIMPYYQGIGEQIKRLGKTQNFRVFFKSSPNLRSILRTDKIPVPTQERPGVVYVIKCGCNASYIGETGNTLLHRFKEHTQCVNRYNNARERLNGTQTRRRGRPQTKDPLKIMEETIAASAVVEHSSQCSHDLQPKVLCRESLFYARKIKEALFIRHNPSINRDKGIEISQVWTNLVNRTGCCSIAP